MKRLLLAGSLFLLTACQNPARGDVVSTITTHHADGYIGNTVHVGEPVLIDVTISVLIEETMLQPEWIDFGWFGWLHYWKIDFHDGLGNTTTNTSTNEFLFWPLSLGTDFSLNFSFSAVYLDLGIFSPYFDATIGIEGRYPDLNCSGSPGNCRGNIGFSLRTPLTIVVIPVPGPVAGAGIPAALLAFGAWFGWRRSLMWM